MDYIRTQKEIPIVGHFHTVVCGGGAAGWSAAVASARQGKKTALIEKFSFLGGTATAGLVVPLSGCYHKEKRVVGGIPWEFTKEMEKVGTAQIELPKGHISFDPEYYKLLAWEMTEKAGVEIFSNCYITGCETDGRRITHVIFESKNGAEALSGDVFIDATGDGDLCHLAQVEMLPAPKELQPMSMCFILAGVDLTTDLLKNHIHHDGKNCKQSVHTLIHDYLEELTATEYVPQFGGPWFNTTMGGGLVAVNLTRAAGDATNRAELTRAEAKMRADAYILVNHLKKRFPEFANCAIASIAIQAGIRETRHIKGLKAACGQDMLNNVIPADSIACCAHPIDIHSAHDNSQILKHLPVPGHIPYGALVPQEYDNLLAAGRCISADRESYATIRVQATVMAIGEAAGVAASLCDRETATKDISINQLHQKLRDVDAIFFAADAR